MPISTSMTTASAHLSFKSHSPSIEISSFNVFSVPGKPPYTKYRITLVDGGDTYIVDKCWKDFLCLNAELEQAFSFSVLPEFPSTHLTYNRKFDPAVFELRTRSLELFMNSLLQNDSVSRSDSTILIDFLLKNQFSRATFALPELPTEEEMTFSEQMMLRNYTEPFEKVQKALDYLSEISLEFSDLNEIKEREAVRNTNVKTIRDYVIGLSAICPKFNRVICRTHVHRPIHTFFVTTNDIIKKALIWAKKIITCDPHQICSFDAYQEYSAVQLENAENIDIPSEETNTTVSEEHSAEVTPDGLYDEWQRDLENEVVLVEERVTELQERLNSIIQTLNSSDVNDQRKLRKNELTGVLLIVQGLIVKYTGVEHFQLSVAKLQQLESEIKDQCTQQDALDDWIVMDDAEQSIKQEARDTKVPVNIDDFNENDLHDKHGPIRQFIKDKAGMGSLGVKLQVQKAKARHHQIEDDMFAL